MLEEIGAAEVPRLVVYNKIDAAERGPAVERDPCGRIISVSVSAKTGQGLDLLRDAIVADCSACARPSHSEPLPAWSGRCCGPLATTVRRRAPDADTYFARTAMSLNDPQWGRVASGSGGGSSNEGDREEPRRPQRPNGEGPPDLEELWRDFNRRLNGLFGKRDGVAARRRFRRL